MDFCIRISSRTTSPSRFVMHGRPDRICTHTTGSMRALPRASNLGPWASPVKWTPSIRQTLPARIKLRDAPGAYASPCTTKRSAVFRPPTEVGLEPRPFGHVYPTIPKAGEHKWRRSQTSIALRHPPADRQNARRRKRMTRCSGFAYFGDCCVGFTRRPGVHPFLGTLVCAMAFCPATETSVWQFGVILFASVALVAVSGKVPGAPYTRRRARLCPCTLR